MYRAEIFPPIWYLLGDDMDYAMGNCPLRTTTGPAPFTAIGQRNMGDLVFKYFTAT